MQHAGVPVTTLRRVERVSKLVQALNTTKHHGFPVVEQTSRGPIYIGIMLRYHLFLLLKTRRAFQDDNGPSDVSRNPQYDATEFEKPVSFLAPKVEEIHVDERSINHYIDLKPYLNPHPYVIQQSSSLGKAHSMLRTLGLRHIAVIPNARRVVGIISRKDIHPEWLEKVLEEEE